MAEGGFDEFENPAFNKDYEEGNVDDADVDTYLTDLFGKKSRDTKNSRTANGKYGTSVKRNTRRYKKKVIKEKLDNFIMVNKERGGIPILVNPGDYHIKDGILHVHPFGTSKEIPLEYKRGGVIQPYNLRYLENKYGIAFIRETLGFQDYVQKPKTAQHQAAKQTLQELSTAEKKTYNQKMYQIPLNYKS